MTQTSTPAVVLPAYDASCEARTGHSLDSITGYDVIVTNTVEGVVRVAVVEVIEGGNQYARALDSMRPLRAATTPGQSYAYVGNRYACGCRQVGRVARTGGCEFVGEMNLSA